METFVFCESHSICSDAISPYASLLLIAGYRRTNGFKGLTFASSELSNSLNNQLALCS